MEAAVRELFFSMARREMGDMGNSVSFSAAILPHGLWFDLQVSWEFLVGPVGPGVKRLRQKLIPRRIPSGASMRRLVESRCFCFFIHGRFCFCGCCCLCSVRFISGFYPHSK